MTPADIEELTFDQIFLLYAPEEFLGDLVTKSGEAAARDGVTIGGESLAMQAKRKREKAEKRRARQARREKRQRRRTAKE